MGALPDLLWAEVQGLGLGLKRFGSAEQGLAGGVHRTRGFLLEAIIGWEGPLPLFAGKPAEAAAEQQTKDQTSVSVLILCLSLVGVLVASMPARARPSRCFYRVSRDLTHQPCRP
jgi:hypothetical protein